MSPWPRKYSFSLGIWVTLCLALMAGTARAESELPSSALRDHVAQAGSSTAPFGEPQLEATCDEASDRAALTAHDAHGSVDRDGDEEEEPKDSLAEESLGLDRATPPPSEGRAFVPVAAPVLQARASVRLPRGPPSHPR